MARHDIGTINKKPITQEMLDGYMKTFERDWDPSEIKIITTERGKALRALHDLNIPLYEIEALEKRAKQKNQTLGLYIHTVLQEKLFAANE